MEALTNIDLTPPGSDDPFNIGKSRKKRGFYVTTFFEAQKVDPHQLRFFGQRPLKKASNC
jgi:hypothetical protein